MSYSIGSIAMFFSLVELCLVLTVQQRRCEDIAGQIDELKRELPADVRLVSIGPVHHAFAFFYERPIPVLSSHDDFSGENDYFCLHTYDAEPPQLPFAWTKFAVISCDRLKGRVIPKDRVFIGHRLPTQQVGMQSLDSTSARSIDPPWSLSP